jgi:hypothetical protein
MVIKIEEPSLLIRISQLYRQGMSAEELYDATRGVWVLGERRNDAAYAFAVANGVVLEVYAIEAWHPAGSTPYHRRVIDLDRYAGRWEFTGRRAPDAMRERYIGRSVAHYFSRGAANPVLYVGC